MGKRFSWLLTLGALAACGESRPPAGPTSFGVKESTVASSSAAATISGTVVDALDGAALGGVTVEVPGIASTATSAEGAFALQVPGVGTVPLVLRADGYHVRETHASVSARPVDVDLLPAGRAFDLDFFDHVFRNLGADHTERWTVEPRFEVWTGVYECETGEFEGECDDLVATGELAPGQFVQIARDVIAADASKYSGGAVLGSLVATREPHSQGKRLTWRDYFLPHTTTVILIRGVDYSFVWRWPYESGQLYSATMQINKVEHKSLAEVHSHELAHVLGFSHPAGHENVPLPSIMRDARAVTQQDELHGRILYRRPPGSRTADEDPADFVVNALRGDAEGPPDPSRIRRIVN